jgi:PAS domain S-box-containing protein
MTKKPTYNELEQKVKEFEKEALEHKRTMVALGSRTKLFMEAHDPIIIEDLEGRVIDMNKEAELSYGWKRKELIGQPIKTIVPPERHEQADSLLARCRQGEPVRNVEGLRLNRAGKVFPVLITLSLLTDEAGEPFSIASTIKDISSLKRIEAELKLKIAELDKSNKALDDFAYIVSHDLREPLRGISSLCSFMLEDYADKLGPKGRSRLKRLMQLTQRLEDLIESILYYSRLGRVDLAFSETDLNAVIAEVIDSMKFSLDEKGIEIRIPKKLPAVRCDGKSAGEVFSNLITNAMKYNDKPQKWIEIGFRPDQDSHVFYVRDNGIGIKEKHQQKIFKMFRRLHGRKKYGGGKGAGLTIVQKIIERHEGKIWVESSFGQGATFYFTLQ